MVFNVPLNFLIWRNSGFYLCSYFVVNRGFSIGIGDVTPGRGLIRAKNRLLSEG